MQLQTITKAVPTHIIGGFLGVGKTTVLQHLLNQRAAHERCAVLVNEFGEIGIDGSWLQQEGVAIKEVPGGCMCCAVGVPTHVALTRLLREQRPDRLFIEPSGLAHPKQLIELLTGDDFQGVLQLGALITLVEPDCFLDERFMALDLFKDQLQMADVLVATKGDVATKAAIDAFHQQAGALSPDTPRYVIGHGALPDEVLSLPHHSAPRVMLTQHPQATADAPSAPALPEPDAEGVIMATNASAGGYSCGWIFPEHWLFDEDTLYQWVSQSAVPRVKGIVATNNGWLRISKMRQRTVVEYQQEAGSDSRLEMIDVESRDWSSFNESLRMCRQRR